MKIKWYWLAEQLGLMEDLSGGNGDVLYRVSAQADDFFEAAFFALIPIFLLAGALLGYLLCRNQLPLARRVIRWGIGILLGYGILLATGVGPYIQFYPQSVGFIDLSPITNILSGLYCAFLALLWGLGGWLGRKLSNRNDRSHQS